MIIAIIFSSLALLAAASCLLLLLRAEKRRTKQRAAYLEYTDNTVRLSADRLYRRCAELEGHLAETQGVLSVAEETIAMLQNRVSALESGTVPDFEKAKEAANAVNDFNAGISGILGFDPMEVIRKQRESAGDV
jgi:hypothetical protein